MIQIATNRYFADLSALMAHDATGAANQQLYVAGTTGYRLILNATVGGHAATGVTGRYFEEPDGAFTALFEHTTAIGSGKTKIVDHDLIDKAVEDYVIDYAAGWKAKGSPTPPSMTDHRSRLAQAYKRRVTAFKNKLGQLIDDSTITTDHTILIWKAIFLAGGLDRLFYEGDSDDLTHWFADTGDYANSGGYQDIANDNAAVRTASTDILVNGLFTIKDFVS